MRRIVLDNKKRSKNLILLLTKADYLENIYKL